MYSIVLLTIVLFLPHSGCTVCEDYHFFNLETSQCTKCKSCRQFEVIFSECSKFNNSVCISLTNISRLSEKEIISQLSGIDFWFDKSPDKKAKVKTSDEVMHVPDTKVNISNWKTLSYSLIGVLGFVGVLATLILLYLWRRRKLTVKKFDTLRNRQGGDTEFGNEYVVFQSRVPPHTSYDEEDVSSLLPRPTIRGCRVIDVNVRKYSRYYRKRLYKPQRRLLTEGVDDVFESEDSGGSRMLRLHTIPERSDSDIDDVLNADKSASTGQLGSTEKQCKKSSTDCIKSSEDLHKGTSLGNTCSDKNESQESLNKSSVSKEEEKTESGEGNIKNCKNENSGSYVNLKESVDTVD